MAVATLNVDGLKELNDDGPVTMLNLVRFHKVSVDGNGSGWDAYRRYSAATMPMIRARGGAVLWSGDAEAVALGYPDKDAWDFAVLVQYPSRAAFLDMMTSKEYETEANPHRENGASEHVIIATRTSYTRFKEA